MIFVTIIPFLFSLLYERQREEDFIFIFINSAILLFPLYFLRNHKIYFLLLFPLLLLPAMFDFGHIFLYQGRISESIFFIIFDTNPAESMEYLESNLSFSFLASCLIYFLVTVIYWLKILKMPKINIETKWYKYLILWLIIPFGFKLYSEQGSLDKTFEAYRRSSHIYSMMHFYHGYQKQLEAFQNFNKNVKKDFQVTRDANIPQKEVHLLVIGESTTSNHMGVYGYHRKTTPHLTERKSEINLFTDVVSSNPPGTMANLKKILTLANTEKENDELLSVNIVNIMKAAGFKTYWVSNQLILGEHDTTTTVFAKQSHKVSFTNTTNSVTYDEKILPIFDRYLSEKEDKKFIVLHLMGSHMKYRHRFPDEYKKFTDTRDIPIKDFHNERKLEYINSYDNAIYYNDYILNEILNRVKNLDALTTVTYLSDHGEEVYREKDLHGHPGTSPTLNMYRIPFFIWTNSSLNLNQYLSRKYVSDDTIHTLLDLFRVNGDFFDSSKSLISPDFVEKKRYMGNIEI